MDAAVYQADRYQREDIERWKQWATDIDDNGPTPVDMAAVADYVTELEVMLTQAHRQLGKLLGIGKAAQ